MVTLLMLPLRAADDVVSAVHGTITKLDSATKTMVVKTKDGTEHTIRIVGTTTVHGTDAAGAGAKDAFHGLKEGSEVVAHYTAKGTEKSAVEVDHVGKDGMKSWWSKPPMAPSIPSKLLGATPPPPPRMLARALKRVARWRSTTPKTLAKRLRTFSKSSSRLGGRETCVARASIVRAPFLVSRTVPSAGRYAADLPAPAAT
jgi:hypothetical protein